MRRGITCETDDAVSNTDPGDELDVQRAEVPISNEVISEGTDSINVRQLEVPGDGSNVRPLSPEYAPEMIQPESHASGSTQEHRVCTDSASARLHEDASSTGADTIGSRDHVERTMQFGLDNHEMVEHHGFQYDTAALSYCEVLRDILGSSAASPAAAGDALMDETGDDIWDQCLNAGQPFADLTGFSFVDLDQFDTNMALDTTVSIGRQETTASFEHAAPAAATQAFHVSGWNWGPSPDDNETAETTNLILPAGVHRAESIQPNPTTQNHGLLKQEDRSRLLSMLLKHCEKEQWVRIASTFPSEQFLNHLLQAFYTLQGRDTLSWFHLPTIPMESLRVECLAAMVGTAACFSLNRSVQRFGYVLPELVRFAVIDQVGNISHALYISVWQVQRLTPVCKWCRDNSTSRDLQLLNSMCTV